MRLAIQLRPRKGETHFYSPGVCSAVEAVEHEFEG